MKLDRNKLIFISVSALLVLFIVGYAFFVLGAEDSEGEITQTEVPEVQEGQKEYDSKLEAIDDVKEIRATNAPSVYNEGFLDSTGEYDPMQEERRRQYIVDSIYREGRIDYEKGSLRDNEEESDSSSKLDKTEQEKTLQIDFKEAHNAFFAYEPVPLSQTRAEEKQGKTDAFILVEVNGEQTVKKDGRLELRLAVDALVNGDSIRRNTLVYGFVSFRANRVFIKITNIEQNPVNLGAYDLLDGNEGIYVQNSFTSEASTEVIGDIIEDINIPGVPQVGGIKRVFQRNNRNVKATIFNQYQLLLKPRS